MKFKNYIDFLNEWHFTKHHLERSNPNHPESRTARFSVDKKHGWKCIWLSRLSEDGAASGDAMELPEFLELSGMNENEFNSKISKTLEMTVTSKLAANTFYEDTEKLHRYVYLGKIAFQVGDELLAPVLINLIDPNKDSGKHAKKFAIGSRIWCDVKNNSTLTFLYFPDSYEDDDLMLRATIKSNRMKGTSAKEKAFYQNMKSVDYRKLVKIEYLRNKNSIIKIPDTPSWKEEVKHQIENDTKF